MLTEEQYLLVCLMEECDEVSQRAAKALRFGLDEVQPGQADTNAQRLFSELVDLSTVVYELHQRGVVPLPWVCDDKIAKIAKYMDYSREQGVLVP
jgi:hypothetical protein